MGYSPAQILKEYNNTLSEQNAGGLFITTFVAVYDPETRTLTVSGCQAGLPVHIYNMSGSEQVSLTTTESATQIAVGHLPQGIYLLQVGSTTVKFQKR